MKTVEFTINKKRHQVVCDADQADHIRQLADMVNEQATGIAEAMPRAPETTVLMMTCLNLADALCEARQEAGRWREQVAYQKGEVSPESSHTIERVNQIAASLDTLSQRLSEGTR